MISVKEAQALVQSNAPTTPLQTLSLQQASGHVLASDIAAPVHHPPFDQTAMDGYAIRWADLATNNCRLQVTAEIPAGTPATAPLGAREAHRIFTGAEVPQHADTVVMQEHTKREGDVVIIDETLAKAEANIRKKGEQILAGSTALNAGTVLNAASIGFLGSLGIQEVEVHQKPTCGIVVTGDEFAQTPEDLNQGKIFESNGNMLEAALAAFNYKGKYQACQDQEAKLQAAFQHAAAENEVLLITGGVSVGNYDFTRPVLESLGFEVIFHKVNQKPGKPLLFAVREGQLAFGLPGNPRAVMMCFYNYVLPALQAMQNHPSPGLTSLPFELAAPLRKRDHKTHFHTVQLDGHRVHTMGKQQSHMLKSMSDAHGIVTIPEDVLEVAAGTTINVQLLPQFLH